MRSIMRFVLYALGAFFVYAVLENISKSDVLAPIVATLGVSIKSGYLVGFMMGLICFIICYTFWKTGKYKKFRYEIVDLTKKDLDSKIFIKDVKIFQCINGLEIKKWTELVIDTNPSGYGPGDTYRTETSFYFTWNSSFRALAIINKNNILVLDEQDKGKLFKASYIGHYSGEISGILYDIGLVMDVSESFLNSHDGVTSFGDVLRASEKFPRNILAENEAQNPKDSIKIRDEDKRLKEEKIAQQKEEQRRKDIAEKEEKHKENVMKKSYENLFRKKELYGIISVIVIIALASLFATTFSTYFPGTAVTQNRVSAPSQEKIIDNKLAPPPLVEKFPGKEPPKPKAAPKPKTEPKPQKQAENKEMRFPNNAWKNKDFSFLEGCWNVAASTSKESIFQYCFDASGNGTRTSTKLPGSYSCNGSSVRTRFEDSGMLHIVAEGFVCKDGNNNFIFPTEKMNCTSKGGKADCTYGVIKYRFNRN